MQELQFTLRGRTPLLMHNVRLANAFNEYPRAIKEITKKRVKTDEDAEQLIRLEFLGGMYLEIDEGPTGEKHQNPYVPSEWIEGTIRDGAKAQRKGQDILRGVIAKSITFELKYDGPNDADELLLLQDFCFTCAAGLRGVKVMRTRCRFRDWEVNGSVMVQENIINVKDVQTALEHAGSYSGIGDWRPKYGQFDVQFHNGTGLG